MQNIKKHLSYDIATIWLIRLSNWLERHPRSVRRALKVKSSLKSIGTSPPALRKFWKIQRFIYWQDSTSGREVKISVWPEAWLSIPS